MFSSSEAISRNMNLSNSNNTMTTFSTSNYKNGLEGELLKNKEMMGSSSHINLLQQQGTGLTRYRSAPSTFFASFLDAANSDSSHGEDEAENMLSAFMEVQDLNETADHHQFPSNLKQERMEYNQQNNGFSGGNPQVGYEAPLIIGNGSNGAVMENPIQTKMNVNGSNTNNLIRQNSSPAGFFNGFDITRETNSNIGLNNHMNFSSRAGAATSSRFMPSIAENVNENTGVSPENQHIYVNGSWNDSTTTSTNATLKRNRDASTFNGLNNQNSGLIHHLSLPKTSAEMAVIENYLQFDQNNVVPCKLRAKRGCATHPRSVAERVRRTRISDRMKKLQELFPNMDKQTNTAEMLDLAVDYIKDLQKQVQTLTDVKAKCTC